MAYTRSRSSEVAYLQRKFGEWLSLVEHLVRDQGVGGSNPLSPTNDFHHLAVVKKRIDCSFQPWSH